MIMKLIKNTKVTAYELNCGYIQKAIFETEKGNIFTISIEQQHAAYMVSLTIRDKENFPFTSFISKECGFWKATDAQKRFSALKRYAKRMQKLYKL